MIQATCFYKYNQSYWYTIETGNFCLNISPFYDFAIKSIHNVDNLMFSDDTLSLICECIFIIIIFGYKVKQWRRKQQFILHLAEFSILTSTLCISIGELFKFEYKYISFVWK